MDDTLPSPISASTLDADFLFLRSHNDNEGCIPFVLNFLMFDQSLLHRRIEKKKKKNGEPPFSLRTFEHFRSCR